MQGEPPRITWILIAAVLLLGAFVYFFYPQADPQAGPEEGRVLAQVRVVEPVGPGFFIADNFTIDADYERIGLSYTLTVAYHVRAALVDPAGDRHNATAVSEDELRLDVWNPVHGEWSFEVWTLDAPERQGRIEGGDLYILGFGGPEPGQT